MASHCGIIATRTHTSSATGSWDDELWPTCISMQHVVIMIIQLGQHEVFKLKEPKWIVRMYKLELKSQEQQNSQVVEPGEHGKDR